LKANSERVPNKNRLDFGGVPLYAHTLLKLMAFECYVDTDSPEIKEEIDQQYPHVTAYERDDITINAKDATRALIERFMHEANVSPFDILVFIKVTAPFSEIGTVRDAIKAVASGEYDSAFPVTVLHEWLYRRAPVTGQLIPLNSDPRIHSDSQRLEPLYMKTNAFSVFTPSTFVAHGDHGVRPYLVEVSYPENVDIDYPEDFEQALATLYYLNNKEDT
jgi:N-acylneuraminate cytidylyltransferase